jgi:hypothetical protein
MTKAVIADPAMAATTATATGDASTAFNEASIEVGQFIFTNERGECCHNILCN